MKAIVVGCGLSGVTAARLLIQHGFQVEIYESRNHIGGNVYDAVDEETGIMVHQYGPHSFNTSSKKVWDYVNRFAEFIPSELKVSARLRDGKIIPIPYNDDSEEITGLLTDDEIRNLLFRDYSEKQWGVPYEELPDSITHRVKVRISGHSRNYHQGKLFTGIPKQGYTAMVQAMLEGITVHLDAELSAWRKRKCDLLIYTGKLDELFDCCYGRLPYRSLRFERIVTSITSYQQLNECNHQRPWTRAVDHSHWYVGQHRGSTVVMREYPQEHDLTNLPYYPMNFGEGSRLYALYAELVNKMASNISMLGRLATYRYLNMDETILQAMKSVERLLI